MINITAQFIITDEALYSNGDKSKQPEIKEAIVRRLRNRSATFDKLVEYDTGGDDNDEQLYDLNASEDDITTLVDVTMTVDEDVLKQLEADPDLVFMKTISELENENVKIIGEWQQENVSHVAFRANS
ncbi:MAG TPA: hypothetical protein VGB44_07680 [Flavobacterium sp.]|jgi:hypothetical protein